jgi:hypothetical protein
VSDAEPAEADRQGVLEVLERHGVRYVVIGGAAAEARGWRGRSLDIDVVPATEESNLDRVAAALNELDARLAVGAGEPDGVTVPGGFDARLLATNTVWNLLTSYGPLDLTFKPAGTDGYEDLVRQATREHVPGSDLQVPVATGADIIRSKAAAGRPKDLAVLPQLRRDLTPGAESG